MATYKERVERAAAERAEQAKAPKKKARPKDEDKYKGVLFDEDTQTYGFRLTRTVDGKRQDTFRKGFPTAYQASRAREQLRVEWDNAPSETETPPKVDYSKTFEDIYTFYLDTISVEKKQGTLNKQDSLWRVHIKPKFGNRRLCDVSKGEMYDYLVQLYYKGDDYNKFAHGYAYSYVEGYLKFFWLIYGVAYDHDWVDPARYAKDFLNPSTKLSMPEEIKSDEDEDIVIYSAEEIEKIREVIKRGSMYCAFMICYHCGLRISECMGLMWEDIDFKEHTIKVRRQLLIDYKNHLFYLGPPKTKNGYRTVYMCKALQAFLEEYKAQQDEHKKSKGYRAYEIVYDRTIKGRDDPITGGNFIHRKENGELLTVNSMKYWSKIVKEETGINFFPHGLRHTCASNLAAHNIPAKALARFLGHGNTNVALKYYITTTEAVEQRIKDTLDSMA